VGEHSPYHSLSLHLKQLRLSHMLNHWQSIEQRAIQQQWSYAQFLLALCQLESERRFQVQMQRALREAQLPLAKSFTNFEFDHCPALNTAALMQFVQPTSWLEQAENLILLGSSGVGKTHLSNTRKKSSHR
jgi:DNA replication protein DnaC